MGHRAAGKRCWAKPAAHNLRLQLKKETGKDHPEFFLSVKGPEILNMWLGESERQVRDLFAQCREKAAEGHLAFLFIDEAESILGTRHAVRVGSNILSTLVPDVLHGDGRTGAAHKTSWSSWPRTGPT